MKLYKNEYYFSKRKEVHTPFLLHACLRQKPSIRKLLTSLCHRCRLLILESLVIINYECAFKAKFIAELHLHSNRRSSGSIASNMDCRNCWNKTRSTSDPQLPLRSRQVSILKSPGRTDSRSLLTAEGDWTAYAKFSQDANVAIVETHLS